MISIPICSKQLLRNVTTFSPKAGQATQELLCEEEVLRILTVPLWTHTHSPSTRPQGPYSQAAEVSAWQLGILKHRGHLQPGHAISLPGADA
jgi:hypothetical protein